MRHLRRLPSTPRASRWGRLLLPLLLPLLLSGCLGLPETVQPVRNFELNRYLGTWYEVARLDHPFERGLSHISATYSLREDGGVRVLNRGFDEAEQRWQQAEGKAYFVGASDTGHLKVSFFGPFYGSYAVFELDQQHYQYAFISGNSTESLWLLARTPTVSDDVRQRFVSRARELGFDTGQLIWVEQGKQVPPAATP